MRCLGQNKECLNEVIMIYVTNTNERFIGGLCFGHLSELSVYANLGD